MRFTIEQRIRRLGKVKEMFIHYSREKKDKMLWDINMGSGPVATFQVHEHLRPKMRKTTSQILDPPTLWSVWVVWLQRMWPEMVEGDGKELQVAVGWPEMVLFVVDMMCIWLVKDKEIWAVERRWSIVTVEWLVVAVEQVGVEQVVVEQ
ncbi:hypothetical protein Tco_0045428 [Tanacetum coccineum]